MFTLTFPQSSQGKISVFFYSWSFWIFVCAADRETLLSFPVQSTTSLDIVVMILRVWALYNQSRLVLGVLLGLYAMEVVLLFARYLLESIAVGSGSATSKRK